MNFTNFEHHQTPDQERILIQKGTTKIHFNTLPIENLMINRKQFFNKNNACNMYKRSYSRIMIIYQFISKDSKHKDKAVARTLYLNPNIPTSVKKKVYQILAPCKDLRIIKCPNSLAKFQKSAIPRSICIIHKYYSKTK